MIYTAKIPYLREPGCFPQGTGARKSDVWKVLWVMARKRQNRKCMDDPIYKIYPDFPVLILDDYQWSEADVKDTMHFHYYLEIGRCNKGAGYIMTERSEKMYRPGDIVMIPPNFLHATRSIGDSVVSWSYLFIDIEDLLNIFRFPAEMNRERLMKICHKDVQIIHKENSGRIHQILEEIYTLNESREGMYKMQIITCLLQVLMEMANMIHKNAVPDNVNGEEAHILPAIDYIYTHYMEQIKIRSLAEMCHFSESHFRKIFLKYKGLAPLEYLNCIRIREAARMLVQTNLPIHVISERCGYQAVSSFERNFIKCMGTLPGKWRIEQRTKDKGKAKIHIFEAK